MSLIFSGLPDQFPDLRLASSHGGGWIHYGLGRFEMRLAHGHDRGKMQGMPSEYLKRFYYDCLVHDPDTLEYLVKKVGASQILIGTDFPFGGDIIGGSTNWINSMSFLSENEKAAMHRWKHEHPDSSLKLQRKLFEKGAIPQLPWQQYLAAEADTIDENESKKKDSRVDGDSGRSPSEEEQRDIGYVQNAEQGQETLWQRIKKPRQ